jgi:hypothetical protein
MREAPGNIAEPALGAPRCPDWLRLFLGPRASLFAWIILAAVILHPPHGLNLPICWMQTYAGVPCPGCGLTRSMSCAVRGMMADSWSYHPFGALFLGAFAFLALLSLDQRLRARLNLFRTAHRRALTIAYTLFIAAFLMFGTARAMLHLTAESARHTSHQR